MAGPIRRQLSVRLCRLASTLGGVHVLCSSSLRARGSSARVKPWSQFYTQSCSCCSLFVLAHAGVSEI